jgi:hypothetical protein
MFAQFFHRLGTEDLCFSKYYFLSVKENYLRNLKRFTHQADTIKKVYTLGANSDYQIAN